MRGREATIGSGATRAVNPWWVACALTLGAVMVLAAVGDPGAVGGVLAGGVERLVPAGVAVGVYLAAAYGLGTVGDGVWRASANRHAYRVGVGVAVMLTLGHGLGVLGLLGAPAAIGLAVVGVALAVRAVAKGVRAGEVRVGDGRWAWIVAVPIGVLVVACASPPGWLWDSEFGGFDALAYHLALPQEWMRAGRVWPVDHNVYSYLPSYVEAAYVQLAQMTLAPAGEGLLAGSAWRAQMAPVLAAALALASAWFVGRVTLEVGGRAGADAGRARAAAWGAGALVVATPWIVVVGSLAYNETGVTALGAAAVLVALDRAVRPVWRGALAGLLVGAACGCKPTAMVFVTPVVGLVLIAGMPRRAWAASVVAAGAAGAVMVAPWMVRNWVACGNPVFPQLAGVFGEGHWTGEQVARFAGAHHFRGGVLERVRLLVADDPSAGAGAALVERFRGAANPQWGLMFPAGAVALVSAACAPRARKWAWVFGAGVAVQVVVWMTLTHLQSRFLIPCVIAVCPLIGVALAAGRAVGDAGRAACAVVVIQTMVLVGVFVTQRHGLPNGKTAVGLTLDVARPFDEQYAAALPWAWVNGRLDPGVRLYVVGDAAVFLYDRAVVSNSTWDSWAIAEVMREHPGEPTAWNGGLRARGIDAVLISPSELTRLERSGWIDPELTPERMRAWAETLGTPAMVWEDVSAVLFVLDGAGDE